MIVFVDVDTDVSQDDEFEAMMAEVEMVVQVFSDPAIKRVKVVEYRGPRRGRSVVIDPTEQARRDLIALMPADLQARVEAGEQVWTTAQLTEEFSVEGFAAPFVVVRRKVDGVRGSLMFTHDPRYDFGWEPAG